jgi:hypothetical protein
MNEGLQGAWSKRLYPDFQPDNDYLAVPVAA